MVGPDPDNSAKERERICYCHFNVARQSYKAAAAVLGCASGEMMIWDRPIEARPLENAVPDIEFFRRAVISVLSLFEKIKRQLKTMIQAASLGRRVSGVHRLASQMSTGFNNSKASRSKLYMHPPDI